MTAPTALPPCARCRSPLESGDLRCAVCGQVAPIPPGGPLPSPVARILRCDECSAAVAWSAEAGAPRCAFCGSVMHVEEPVDPVETSELYLPFGVSAEDAQGVLRSWLSSRGWLRPSDLASAATLDALHPLFWAGWIFDAEAVVGWTADSNAGSRRADWAPHAGEASMTFSQIVVSASRGLSNRETSALAAGYDLATARPEPEGPEDAIVEQFDVQRSAARQIVAGAIESVATERVQSQHVPGSRFRNVHVSVLVSGLVTRRVSLPAWVLAYRYRDKLYRVVVHGQDSTRVIGEAPLSVAKIALLVVAGLALVALILLLGSS